MKKNILISVIITTYNRPKNIFKIIKIINRQEFKHGKIEILICDSKSESSKKIKAFLNKNKLNHTKHLIMKKNHQAYKRNFGAKKAKGKFIIFLDDDCFPAKNFLNNYYKKFLHNKKKTIYCGDVKYKYKKSIKNLIKFRDQTTIKSSIYKNINIPIKNIVTMNMGLKKDSFKDYKNFFNLKFNYYGFEDFELAYRLNKKGFKFQMVNSKIYHKDFRNFRVFLEKFFYLGCFGIKEFVKINSYAANESIFYKISKNYLVKLILNIPFIFYMLDIVQKMIVLFESKIDVFLPKLYKFGMLISFMKGLSRFEYEKNNLSTYKKNLKKWYE